MNTKSIDKKDNSKSVNISNVYQNYLYLINLLMTWLKEKLKLEGFRESIKDKQILHLFDNNLFPTIQLFLQNKDKCFIRHGLEIFKKSNYDKNSDFPIINASCWNHGHLYFNPTTKKSFWSKEKQSSNYSICYPIEVDMFPFCINMDAYKNRKWPSDRQYGYCSNHDSLFSWNKLKGYMTFNKFKELGGNVVHSMRRDHLYACSQINTYEWTFVFQNEKEDIEKSKYWGWTQKNFNEDQYVNDIGKILLNNGKIISQELLFLLYKFV